VEYQDENIFTGTGDMMFGNSCYRIHRYKETKDCNQEGIEKKQKQK
jgi:hypothetical protein